MIKKYTEKGITLIALIITIIIMLILVGVTITVAMQGGLFDTARKASYQTEIAMLKEQLEIARAIKIAENGGRIPTDYAITIDDLDIDDKVKNKYRDKLIIQNGKLYYNPEIVTDIKEQKWLEEIEITPLLPEDELADLKNYLTVKATTFLEAFLGVGEEFESELLKHTLYYTEVEMDRRNEQYIQYMKYNNKIFKVIFPPNPFSTYKDISCEWNLANENKEYEGTFVSYDSDGDGIGENWIVLYNENSKIQLLKMGALAYDLSGYEKGYDLDRSGTIDNIEKAVFFYNHIYTELNEYAETQITEIIFKESVRCLGTNPSNPKEDNAEYWPTYSVWDLPQANKTGKYPNYVFQIKKGDTNYKKDYEKTICLSLGAKKILLNNQGQENYGAEKSSLVFVSRVSEDANQADSIAPWIGLYCPMNLSSRNYNIINHMEIKPQGSEKESTYAPNLTDNRIPYYPVVTLKSEVKIDTSRGDGSFEKPYGLMK